MLRVALIAFGFANAILYSAILPLWEGFDEPFHFAYVQYLANGQGLPDPRTSVLSREVAASIAIAPASNVVRDNLPQVATFSEFFAWPRSDRAAMKARLREIPRDWSWQPSNILIYEALHPPLAYLLLAGPERWLARLSLPGRVLALRIAAALAATALLYIGASRLYSELDIPEAYGAAAIFCTFSLQMTWATLAHVANDWLSVPLAVCSVAAMVGYWKRPRLRVALCVGGLIAAGLLTKAYFLALTPAALVVCLARKRWRDAAVVTAIILISAGPWYVRNVVHFGSLTGMQETRSGIGPAEMVRSAATLNWPQAAGIALRSALWTGNSSFTSFSLRAEIAIIALWFLAMALWAIRRHGGAEWIVALYGALFAVALVYVTLLSHAFTGGVAKAPSPWYSQVLVAPLLGLAFLGCARSRKLGSIVASLLTLAFGHFLVATYIVKLIPLYGGFEQRTSLAALAKLYSTQFSSLAENLDWLSLGPASLIFTLTLGVVVLAIALLVRLCAALNRELKQPGELA